jgi:hypothetical protein
LNQERSFFAFAVDGCFRLALGTALAMTIGGSSFRRLDFKAGALPQVASADNMDATLSPRPSECPTRCGRERRITLMARLIVVAASEDTIAAPGNRRANYIEVSVTDANGEPVTGLGASNFKVDPMIVGPGGALVNITAQTVGRLPGFYHIEVLPIRTETWKAGVYIFAVAVERGRDKGQTLTSVLMD